MHSPLKVNPGFWISIIVSLIKTILRTDQKSKIRNPPKSKLIQGVYVSDGSLFTPKTVFYIFVNCPIHLKITCLKRKLQDLPTYYKNFKSCNTFSWVMESQSHYYLSLIGRIHMNYTYIRRSLLCYSEIKISTQKSNQAF